MGTYIECFYETYSLINELVVNFYHLSTKNEEKCLRTIIYYQSMTKQIYELLYTSMLSDEKDIFYASEDSPEWQRFLNYFEEYDPFPQERKVIKSYCKFCEWAILMNATFSKGFKKDSNVDRVVELSKSALNFFVSKSKRIDQYMNYIANPDIKLAKRMINIFDNKYVVSAYQLNLANVLINELIYVPKMWPKIDLDSIKHLYSMDAIMRLEECKEYPTPQECYITSPDARDTGCFHRSSDYDTETHVQVRLLSNVNLPYSIGKNQWSKIAPESIPEQYPHLLDMLTDLNVEVEDHLNNHVKGQKGFKETQCKAVTKAVIHVHGGGFITMSSGSHQVYTRTWANRLD